MKSAAVLILVASVIGSDGDLAVVDAGSGAGLRPGDEGAVFYELTVRDETRRVAVTRARVVRVLDDTATLRATAETDVREGYKVEFSFSADRLAGRAPPPADMATELAELRRRLGEADERVRELERQASESAAELADLQRSLEAARAAAIPRTTSPDGEQRARQAEEKVAELEQRLTATRMETAERIAELQQALDAVEGKAALLQAELKRAEAAHEQSLSSRARGAVAGEETPAEADEPVAAPAVPAEPVSAPSDLDAGMVRIPAGRYSIGLPVSEASFYNQTPRFSRQLEAFWIDSEPVSVEEFASRARTGGSPGRADYQTAITFAQAAAHCHALGRRLPTEVEWEAALTSSDLAAVPSLLEWTASWYEPYPGNDRSEIEYGQRFRVIRASDGNRHDRRYMAPGDRDSAVGFRCLREQG